MYTADQWELTQVAGTRHYLTPAHVKPAGRIRRSEHDPRGFGEKEHADIIEKHWGAAEQSDVCRQQGGLKHLQSVAQSEPESQTPSLTETNNSSARIKRLPRLSSLTFQFVLQLVWIRTMSEQRASNKGRGIKFDDLREKIFIEV